MGTSCRQGLDVWTAQVTAGPGASSMSQSGHIPSCPHVQPCPSPQPAGSAGSLQACRHASVCTVRAAGCVLLVSRQERHQWMAGTALPSLEKGLLPCPGQSLSFLQCKQGGELALQSPR